MKLSICNFQTQTHDEDFTQIYLFHEAPKIEKDHML